MFVQVEEIHTLFPHISIHTISTDLNTTNSVTQTIDNILSGAVIDTLDQPHPVTHPLPTIQSLSSTHIVQESPIDSRSDEQPTQTGDIKGFDNELRQRRRLEKYNEDEKDNSNNSTQDGGSSSNNTISNGDLTFEDKKKRLILESRKYVIM